MSLAPATGNQIGAGMLIEASEGEHLIVLTAMHHVEVVHMYDVEIYHIMLRLGAGITGRLTTDREFQSLFYIDMGCYLICW